MLIWEAEGMYPLSPALSLLPSPSSSSSYSSSSSSVFLPLLSPTFPPSFPHSCHDASQGAPHCGHPHWCPPHSTTTEWFPGAASPATSRGGHTPAGGGLVWHSLIPMQMLTCRLRKKHLVTKVQNLVTESHNPAGMSAGQLQPESNLLCNASC